MFDRILLATDGSEAAAAAVEMAIDLAAENDAILQVLYVADTTSYSTVTLGGEVADVLEHEGEDVTQAVENHAAEAGVETVGAVRQGRPWEEIVEYGETIDADVIVMGTRGESGFAQALLGSVTDRVLRSSSIPVFVVPER